MTSSEILESALDRGQKYFQWLDTVHGPLDIPVVEAVEKACGVIWDRKGKRLRCHFVHWFSEPYQITPEQLKLYTWAVEAIHTATLLHDDVIDKAELRRAGPSANQLYDNTIPILSGDYLMSDAIHQLALKGHPDLMKSMCLALKDLSQGEVLQYQQQFKIAYSEQFYRQLCRLKTASLLTWAASVGPTLHRHEKERLSAIRFAEIYGLLYQFTDDLLDIRGTITKETHKDLNEGKLNWAAWKLVENNPKLKSRLNDEFSLRKISSETFEMLNDAFNNRSHQKLLSQFLTTLRTECLEVIQTLESSELRYLLNTLVDFTLNRAQ